MNTDEKTSVFCVNKSQAMDLLMRNKNALIMMNNILACHYYKFFRENDLNDDECYFRFRDVRTRPEMTESQKKTALKNLVYYGFIEILEDTRNVSYTGCKKIKIVANPFSRELADILKTENPYRGYPGFL